MGQIDNFDDTVKRPRTLSQDAPLRPMISAVMISCNEAHIIEPCLQSVANWVDEIVVIDMMSTDGTRDIIRRYTDKIYDHERLPFVEPARNFALSKASCDWIILLDPDERVTPALATELQRIASADFADAVLVPWQQVVFGLPAVGAHLVEPNVLRFFRNGTIDWPPRIHESPDISNLRVYSLPMSGEHRLLHDTWRSIPQVMEKLLRYSAKDADNLEAINVPFSPARMFYNILLEFTSRMYKGRAYEDGMAGLALALIWPFYKMLGYLQLWEKQGHTHAFDRRIRRLGRLTRGPGMLIYRILTLRKRGK
jgi:glycosyltransferase involved in cell wall biosynthesis